MLARSQVCSAILPLAAGLATLASSPEVARADDAGPVEPGPDPEETRLDLGEPGFYLALDGSLRSVRLDYAYQLADRDPVHWLSLGEEGLWLLAGVAWYGLDRERNLADWDLPSWKERFTLEAWRFDNNHFPINFMGHVLSGAAYYAVPRANDHSLPVATAYAFMTSFVWEFFIEFREKVSVNDLILTLGAGMSIGEFAHRTWRYFAGLPPDASTGRHVLSGFLAPPIYLRRAIDGTPQSRPGPYDALGFSNETKLHVSGGYRATVHDYGEAHTTHGFWFEGRASSVPGEGLPGSFLLFFYDADRAALEVTGAVGEQSRHWELRAKTQLLGLYGQVLDRGGDGLWGTAAWTLAYRYRFQDFPGFNDRLGILHLPGLEAELHQRRSGIGYGLRARLNGDFAGLHSAAYGRWKELGLAEGEVEKTVLRKHNYYYAWGGSGRLEAQLDLGPLTLAGGAALGLYDSQEGLDRSQEALTIDSDLRDRVIDLDLSLGLRVPDTPVVLRGTYGSTARRSRLDAIVVDRRIQSWALSVGAGF
ncbi:MAG: DUF3943 domain-containing protein [Myxococcales bacterium]|nr:DUF3943 domain-containing protein [Myxococcales bacterium]